MKRILIVSIMLAFVACKNESKESAQAKSTIQESTKKETPFNLTPIQHATFVAEWGDEVVYVDPTGGKESFEQLPKPGLILITDIHGDHFDVETLKSFDKPFDIVAPKAVYEQMPNDLQSITKTIDNGETIDFHGFAIEAIPMYNITSERKKFHTKGRGNGYVISRDGYSVYVSGDTEDIPEMRNLENIDLAFICMNLPYTMTPEAAAEATLEFKPKKVLPYHYRGMKDGERHYFDVEKFKTMVTTQNDKIEVDLLNWYPSS